MVVGASGQQFPPSTASEARSRHFRSCAVRSWRHVGEADMADGAEENVKPNSEESLEASSGEEETSPGDGGETSAAAKTFRDLGVTEVLCEACDQLGWKSPTKIQIEAVPVALQGERTGTQ
ncbi:ATP-dependent rRNA helicase RRP3-like, partial [Plectropomus leopardus]|uniref:ATP-dependent rRNA helicase RRP3-like n=1 Tax=Plectropomus leopardus TaxID=160734 RepID=UPI001C4BC3C1